MNYPLISEYIEAVRCAEDNFDKLSHLRPVMDDDGKPVMSSGNFAVVFKMTDGKRNYALKCFLREQAGRDEAYRMIAEELEYISSPYLAGIKYYERELFVDTGNTTETEFPVLLMDWIEGVPLDKYIDRNIDSSNKLKLLAYQFCELAMWLHTQSFAHGDLQPDNILVTSEGQLALVDYDGMYVPAMEGQKARELGCPDYRHPFRTEDDFNEHIDDFSLASIALSLKAISLDASLFGTYGAVDRLLFSAYDYQDLNHSDTAKDLTNLFYDEELSRLYALFLIAHSSMNLSAVSSKLFRMAKPKIEEYEEGELIVIPEGTTVIKKKQFYDNKKVKCIIIPNSVTKIGDCAFRGCSALKEITIPNSVKTIGDWAFNECSALKEINIPNSVTNIGNCAFKECNTLKEITIPNSVTNIGDAAFSGCSALKEITIPNSVTNIGDWAFGVCSALKEITIPNSVTNIGDAAFTGCNENLIIHSTLIKKQNGVILTNNGTILNSCLNVIEVTIPNSVTNIGEFAFFECSALKEITIPNSVTNIGNSAFSGCSALKEINIPNSITNIKTNAFEGCNALKEINIPNSVTNIGEGAFYECNALKEINIPNSVTKIEDWAFSGCSALKEINIPNSVTIIERSTFWKCSALKEINIPNSVTTIRESAFYECSALKEITIPNSITNIEDWAFGECSVLKEIKIPNSVTTIGRYTFNGCNALKEITIPNSVTTIGICAFWGCDSLNSIYVPLGSKEKFKNMLGQEYADKIKEITL